MPYIAKRTLHHKSRFINKGDIVPSDYRRLSEGLRKGWITNTDGPAAADPPPVKGIVDKSDAAPNEVEPEAAQEVPAETIESLDYLQPMAKKSLAEKSVILIADLRGWTIGDLKELRGIGEKLATRLIADYEAFAAMHGVQEANYPDEEPPGEVEIPKVSYYEDDDSGDDDGDEEFSGDEDDPP